MRAALGLARRGVGNVWPNPAVGCVIASADRPHRVLARGWTRPGGRPHAEREALDRAGAAAKGAVAYVTLEPCSHHGQTPPCADALITAGVRRVVIAHEDPDPRVSGRGVAALRAAGIEVTTGLLGAEAEEVNAGYLMRLRAGRPLVTLKLATTLDGRIATAAGNSRWITGEAARRLAHLLRARHDAVIVGVGTALADDPRLDCRLPGLPYRPVVRIVVDGGLRLPADSRLVAAAGEGPVWVVTRADADPERHRTLTARGVEIIDVAAGDDGRPDPAALLQALGQRGLTRVMVEGGGTLAASLVRAVLVDRLAWFRAPRLIGGDGQPAVGAMAVETLVESADFIRDDVRMVGDDMLESYRRRQ